MSTDDQLRRIAAQHARAERALGVESVRIEQGDADPPTPAPEAAARTAHAAVQVEAKARPVVSPADREARQQALDEIRERYERDAPHQHFVTAHTNIVFGDGDPCARLMFVGEAPGEEEDKQGIPFVGRAGQLLNKMIVAMGLRREDVYIANVLKTRPPNNATPTIDEAMRCAPYLMDQIGVVSPEALVTLGLPATRLLLGSTDTMGRLRGKWVTLDHPGGRTNVMPTYHPAYLLRAYTKENRAKVWSDLKQVVDRLGLTPAATPG